MTYMFCYNDCKESIYVRYIIHPEYDIRKWSLLKRGGVYILPENPQHWDVAKQQKFLQVVEGSYVYGVHNPATHRNESRHT